MSVLGRWPIATNKPVTARSDTEPSTVLVTWTPSTLSAPWIAVTVWFQRNSILSRLPTTEELLSILRPPTVERDICLDPRFAPSIHWLWSADHCNKKQAWMADIVESYLGRQDLDGTASVCGVSG